MSHQTDESTYRREYTNIVEILSWSASLGFGSRFCVIHQESAA